MTVDFLLETEGETLKLRLLALFVAVVGLALYQTQVSLAPTLLLCAAYLAYSLLLRSFIMPRFGSSRLVYAMILVDAATIAVGLNLAGGIGNIFFVLMPIFIVYYASYLAYTSALFAATAMGLAYVSLAIFEGQFDGRIIAAQVLLFYLLALFSGYLGQRCIKERVERMALRETLKTAKGAEALLEVSRRLHRNLRLEAILEEIVQTAHLTGLPHCAVALWESDGGCFVGTEGNIRPKELGLRRWADLVDRAEKGSVTALAIEMGSPVVADETELPPWMAPMRPATFLAAPLAAGKAPIGMIYLFEMGGEHRLTEGELRLIQGFANVAAMAITNARVYESAQVRIGQLAGRLQAAIQPLQRQRVLEVGDFHIDLLHRQAKLADQPLDLSSTEFALLRLLAERAGQPVSHEALYRDVWGGVYDRMSNVVNVCVHRLRQKVEADPASPKHIITVRGVGYMLADGSSGGREGSPSDEPSPYN